MCTAAYSTAQTDAAISAVEHWIANSRPNTDASADCFPGIGLGAAAATYPKEYENESST